MRRQQILDAIALHLGSRGFGALGVGIIVGVRQVMKSHRAILEQTEDGRWRVWIDTLSECEVVADTQGEALVALRKAAEAHVEFKYVTVRLKAPEEGIHIPKKLIEGWRRLT